MPDKMQSLYDELAALCTAIQRRSVNVVSINVTAPSVISGDDRYTVEIRTILSEGVRTTLWQTHLDAPSPSNILNRFRQEYAGRMLYWGIAIGKLHRTPNLFGRMEYAEVREIEIGMGRPHIPRWGDIKTLIERKLHEDLLSRSRGDKV